MSPSSTSPAAGRSFPANAIDASARVPLFVLFVGGAAWLVVSSLFGLLASIQFHSPDFVADCAWLTYGRVHAIAAHAFLYGFALPAGFGVALWIFAQLGRNPVSQPWLIGLGAKLWNLGVLVGLLGILLGDSTGFEHFEMPRYGAMILFIGYLVIGVWTALTLHQREERSLRPSQWFLLAALLWFPWVFSTAQLLLNFAPARGAMQAIVNWWYGANLTLVWFGLVGLATLLHFLPKLVNRPLHSDSLARFTFWTLILFASWAGVPASAPVPAWMPAISTVATVLTLVTVLSVMVNVYRTVGRGCSQAEYPPAGRFFAFGVMAFVVSWLMNIAGAIPPVASITEFTWFTVAKAQLNSYGFFAMTLFGAIYYIVPRVTGLEWPCASSVRAHFWLASGGIVLIVLPLALGGVLQGLRLNHPTNFDFVALSRSTLLYLRISTVGELCLLAGHLLLVANVVRLSVRYWRTHVLPVYAAVTAELKPAEVEP